MNENYHKCTRCGYSTNHLVTFKRHLSRKNICKNILSNDNLTDLYIKYNIVNKIDNKIQQPQKTPKNPKIQIETPKNPKKNKITQQQNCQ